MPPEPQPRQPLPLQAYLLVCSPPATAHSELLVPWLPSSPVLLPSRCAGKRPETYRARRPAPTAPSAIRPDAATKPLPAARVASKSCLCCPAALDARAPLQRAIVPPLSTRSLRGAAARLPMFRAPTAVPSSNTCRLRRSSPRFVQGHARMSNSRTLRVLPRCPTAPAPPTHRPAAQVSPALAPSRRSSSRSTPPYDSRDYLGHWRGQRYSA